MGYIHKEISTPFIIISFSKMKGYNLQQPRYTSSSLSHSLSHTITYINFTMLEYNTQLYYNAFIFTMGKYHRMPKTMGM